MALDFDIQTDYDISPSEFEEALAPNPEQEFDSELDTSLAQSTAAVNGVMSEAVKMSPEEAAHKRRVERRIGLPPEAFDKSADDEYKFRLFGDHDLSENPRVRSLLQDRDTAAIAQDDIGILKGVERWFDASKAFENFGAVVGTDIDITFEGLRLKALGGVGNSDGPLKWHPVMAIGSLPDRAFNAMGFPSMSDRWKTLLFSPGTSMFASLPDMEEANELLIEESVANVQALEKKAGRLTPPDLTVLEKMVRGAGTSVVANTPGIVAAIATRSPHLPLMLMGSQTYARSKATGMAGGLSDSDSDMFAAIDATIEVLTEITPALILTKVLKGQTNLKKGAMQFFVGDQVGEFFATLGQSFNAYKFGLDEEMSNAKTLEEKVEIQLERQIITAGSTLIAGGAQIGAAKGMERGLYYVTNRAQQTEAQTNAESKALDELDKLATASKTQTRDPETFAQMFEGDTRDVQVKKEALDAYLFEKRLEIESGNAPGLKVLQDASEATEEGMVDVAVPIGVYASSVVGTEHYDALRSDVKINVEGVTPNELPLTLQRAAERADEIVLEADAKIVRQKEIKDVFETTKQQLLATGRVTKNEVDRMASMVSTWVDSYAKANGESVSEAFEASGLQIKGPEGYSGEKQRGFFDPKTNVLRLLKTSDPSTFTHEFGHFMLEQERVRGRTEDIDNWFFETKEAVATEANRLIGNGIKYSKPKPKAPAPPPKKKAEFGLEAETTPDIGSIWSAAPRKVDYGFSLREETATTAAKTLEVVDRTPQIRLAIEQASPGMPKGVDATHFENVIRLAVERASPQMPKGVDPAHLENVVRLAVERASPQMPKGVDPAHLENVVRLAVENVSPQMPKGVDPAHLENAIRLAVERAGSQPKGFDTISEEAATRDGQTTMMSKADQRELLHLEKQADKLKKEETVQKALARAGGLNRESWEAEGVDPQEFKSKVKVFGKPLFPREGGKTADGVAEYFNEIALNGRTDYTSNEALDIVSESLSSDMFIDPEVQAEMDSIDQGIESLMYGDVMYQGPRNFPGVKEVTPDDIVNYLDIGSTGSRSKDIVIKHAMHEIFARGFETYLLQNKAPTPALRKLYDQMATMLARVYKKVRGDMLVDISGGRAIYDRLLAADIEIDLAIVREDITPLFTDRIMDGKANMSEDEFRKYQEKQAERSNGAKRTLRDQLISELKRPLQQWWTDEKESVVAELRPSVLSEQVHSTRTGLTTSDIKLNRKELKERTGSKKVPPAFAKMTDPKGITINEAAQIFGYPSAGALLDDLQNSPTLEQDLDMRAEAEMTARHGDILNDGTIEAKADQALQDEDRARIIVAELKELRKGSSLEAVKKGVVRETARQRIRKMSYSEINPAKYRRAESMAAQQAAAAFKDGDLIAAEKAKSQELMFHYLALEAVEARKLANKVVDRTKRYNKASVKKQIVKAGDGYWERLVGILVRFEFRRNATDEKVQKTNQALAEWARSQTMDQGDEIILSPEIANESYVTNWKNVPIIDLEGIDEALRSIENAAKNANTIQVEGDRLNLQGIVDKFLEQSSKQRTVFKGTRSHGKMPMNLHTKEGRAGYAQKVKQWVAGGMAKMTKVTMLMKWLDGSDFGMMTKLMSVRLTGTANDYKVLVKNTSKPINDAIHAHMKKHSKRMHSYVEGLPEIGDDKLLGKQLISVFLNAGSKSNIRKMLLGEGWVTEDKPENMTSLNPVLQAIFAKMHKDDIELGQLILDQIDTLYEPMAEVSRRSSGVIPPKVKASPIVTPHGTYRGGYFTMDYDHDRGTPEQRATVKKYKMERESSVEATFSSLGSRNQSVTAGATNTRTEFFAPINFSLDAVPNHIREVSHYITHHEAIRDLNRLFRDPRMQEEIVRIVGPEEADQIVPLLNAIAKNGNPPAILGFGHSMMKRLRNGATYGYLAYKVSTVFLQPLGAFTAMATVGGKRMANAQWKVVKSSAAGAKLSTKAAWNRRLGRAQMHVVKTLPVDDLSGPWAARDFAMQNSKVLIHRVESMDREMHDANASIKGTGSRMDSVRQGGLLGMAYTQLYTVDIPTWHAAYELEFERSEDHNDAVNYADQLVKETQGSADTVDTAAFLRGNNEFANSFFSFMTFFSASWNMSRDLNRKALRKEIAPQEFAARVFYMYVATSIAEMYVRGDWDVDWDDDDEVEEVAVKLAKKLVTAQVQGLPYGRDLANVWIGGFDYDPSPAATIMREGVSAMGAVYNKTLGDNDNDVTGFEAKKLSFFLGALVKAPGTSQGWATGEHIYDVINNGEEATMRELWQGPKRDD